MKLLINTSLQRFGGAVQVALSFIYECRHFPAHEYHVLLGSGVQKSLVKADFPANFRFYDLDFGVISLKKTAKVNKTLRKYEREIKPDCVFTTSGPSYFHSDAPQLIGFNLPLYAYPESPFVRSLSPFKKQKLTVKKGFHYYFFKRDADAYVTQTEDMNNRVRKELDTDKVYTVSNTHNGFYTDWKTHPNKLPAREGKRVRLLSISSFYGHKNLDIIPELIKELKGRGRDNIDFILTLKEKDFTESINPGQLKELINIGPVPPEECPSLYAECDIMFLPTLAESFSASYPEAMVMEKPIVTTDLGFARSICGEAALFFAAKDPASAADRIEELLDNKVLWNDLIKKGKAQLKNFDNPRTRAKKYLALCEQLVGK